MDEQRSSATGASRLIGSRYEVIETMGRGGQGTVVKALDTHHDRIVALKIRRLPDDSPGRERLLSEVRTLHALTPHPGLPLARDDFVDNGRHVLVLDWVDGIDLGRVLATDGVPGLPPSTVLRWAAQAADALTHLHHHDPPIVHGDVTPSNLVLDRSGRIVCVDLGVSSVPGRSQRGGTPGYRAPELAAGVVPTPAADVYGLAATVFALLTGEPPTGRLPSWSAVDTDTAQRLEAALRLGLATQPHRRPATAGELVELMRAGEPDSLPTGTVTVLATSVVDSVALWEAHPLDMPAALARHALIVDRVIERHGGRRLGDDSDAEMTLSVFGRAADAVCAAVDLNRDMIVESVPAIHVRAGAHSGHVGRSGHGPTVNRATTVRGLAGPGQVLVTATTARLVAAERPDGVVLVPLGRHRLEGIADGEEISAISAAGLDVPPDPSVAPYPGLLPFTASEADVYVGRDDEVAALRRLIRPGCVVAVLGSSGSGKSSLLRAGLLPHLPDATVCTPGIEPLASIDAAGDGVIIVDQLEELVTVCDDPVVQQRFVQRICAHPAGVVVGLRTDAFAGMARFPALADAIAERHVLLVPLGPAQLQRAIEEPAERRGLRLEAGLVELVLSDAGDEPGALPLVGHALRETWLRRDGRTLTVAGYQTAGGVQGAIATSADAVFKSLDRSGQDQMRAVLLRMVRPGEGIADSRRRVELEELRDLGEGDTVERMLGRLADARLVTIDAVSAQPAHEALLRAWPRLAEWIADERGDLRQHRHLTAAARAWDSSGRDPAEIYRGARLDAVLELARRATLTRTEQQFVDASCAARLEEAERAAATTRRLRRSLAGVGVALIIALIGATLAIVQARRVADERDRADTASIDADSARLAAEARALASATPDLALLLAVEANRRDDTVESRSALLGALTAHPQLVAKLHGVDSGLESIAWSPDGSTLAAPTSDSTGTLLWDATTFDLIGAPLDTGEQFRLDFDATFTPDGATMLVVGVTEQRSEIGPTGATASLEIWDVATRTHRSTVGLSMLPDSVAALDDSHALVIGQPLIDGDIPDSTAAIQAVDLDAAVATDPQIVLVDPIALDVVGGRVALLSADGTLQVSGLGQADLSSFTSFDVSASLHANGAPAALAYDPAGGLLAISGASGSVDILALSTQGAAAGTATFLRHVGFERDSPSVMSFSADGTLLAVGGVLGSTQLFDTTSGLPAGPTLAGLASEVNDVAFSPGGEMLAVAGLDHTGSIWSLDGSRSIGEPIDGQLNAVVATMPLPDGVTLLTASYDGSLSARSADTDAELWNVETGEPIWSAVLDPGGTRVAIGGADGHLVVLDASDGSPTSGPVQFDFPIEALAWSPSASVLAVGGDRGDAQFEHRLAFLDPATLAPTGEPVITTGGSAISLAFSPDSTRLAVVLDNNLVRVVDVAARRLETRYLESVDVPYYSVAWSPDGRQLATGTQGGTVQLWDAETLEPFAPPGQTSGNPVRGLAFSNDGALLASTTELATTQLWDAKTGAPIGGALVGGELPITVFNIPEPERPEIPFVPGFSADGRHLFVGGDAPMIWSLDPEDWRAAACAVAGRELTEAERDRYLDEAAANPTCSG